MARLVVAVDPGVGVEVAELARLWNADGEALAAGPASTQAESSGTYLPDVNELIMIPLAVNLASNVVYDLVRRLVTRMRAQPSTAEELEIVEQRVGDDRLVAVRVRRTVG